MCSPGTSKHWKEEQESFGASLNCTGKLSQEKTRKNYILGLRHSINYVLLSATPCYFNLQCPLQQEFTDGVIQWIWYFRQRSQPWFHYWTHQGTSSDSFSLLVWLVPHGMFLLQIHCTTLWVEGLWRVTKHCKNRLLYPSGATSISTRKHTLKYGLNLFSCIFFWNSNHFHIRVSSGSTICAYEVCF